MFYWSKNEIIASKRLGKHYLIYAVLFNNDGKPIEIKKVITNPHEEIFVLKNYEFESTEDYTINI